MWTGLRDKTKVLHGQTRYTTFLPHPSHPLHHSPSTLSAVSHLSVTVCRLGLSGIICRYQEQIISETPVPYFGVFNFQIVLQDVSSMGQAPYNPRWRRLQSVPVTSLVEVDVSALLHQHLVSAVC